MSEKKKPLSPEEQTLFQEAMKGVRPLKDDRVVAQGPVPRTPAEMAEEELDSVRRDMLADSEYYDEIEAGEGLLFVRSGLQHRVIRKLRKGRYAIQAELDLHRMTSELARRAIQDFLHQACSRNLRCVRIIHGKGNSSQNRQPVLKGKVARWLKQLDEVLAYCSAQPRDGGSGALYVLLKKQGR